MSLKINLIPPICIILLLSGCATTDISSSVTETLIHDSKEDGQVSALKDRDPPTKITESGRKLQHILHDGKLAKTVKSELRKHPYINQHSQITVITFDQEIYLIGSVETSAIKTEVEKLTSPLSTHPIHNLLLVGKITPNKAQDLWLTTKVKTWLIASQYFTSNIQVACFNGTIYLIGFAIKTEINALQEDIQKVIDQAILSSHLKPIIKEHPSWKD